MESVISVQWYQSVKVDEGIKAKADKWLLLNLILNSNIFKENEKGCPHFRHQGCGLPLSYQEEDFAT